MVVVVNWIQFQNCFCFHFFIQFRIQLFLMVCVFNRCSCYDACFSWIGQMQLQSNSFWSAYYITTRIKRQDVKETERMGANQCADCEVSEPQFLQASKLFCWCCLWTCLLVCRQLGWFYGSGKYERKHFNSYSRVFILTSYLICESIVQGRGKMAKSVHQTLVQQLWVQITFRSVTQCSRGRIHNLEEGPSS